jgi:integrase
LTGFPTFSRVDASKKYLEAWSGQLESAMRFERMLAAHEKREPQVANLPQHLLPKAARGGLTFGEIMLSELPNAPPVHRAVLLRAFGDKRIDAISRADVRQWLDDQLAVHKSGTVQKYFSTLRRVFAIAERDGVLPNGSPALVEWTPRVSPARERVLTREEERKLLAVARPDLALLIKLALLSAARFNELLSMEWELIERFSDRSEYLLPASDTKTGKPRVLVFWGWLAPHDKSGKVFPLSQERYRQLLTQACEKVGINDLVVHDFRHTALTRAAEAGASVTEIMALSGHSSIAAASRYIHMETAVTARRVAERVARAG